MATTVLRVHMICGRQRRCQFLFDNAELGDTYYTTWQCGSAANEDSLFCKDHQPESKVDILHEALLAIAAGRVDFLKTRLYAEAQLKRYNEAK